LLQRYYQEPPIDFQQVLESNLELGARLEPLVADVTGMLEQLSADGRNVLFEGAQGAMLDVDLGTYPYVTSSTTTAGGAAAGTGLGPRRLHEVLGIVKAYATRVGAGPFPTELFDEFGEYLSRVGHEFGSVTGRRRRCGWFDAVALRRSIVHNSCSLLCVTKLDVLDELDTIRVCVGYEIDGAVTRTPPLLCEHVGEARAVYEDLPGWKTNTAGITRYEELPANARQYLERLQSLVGVPITMISTGPDRGHTIIRENPFV
jgi:adenylosuccinate synthase